MKNLEDISLLEWHCQKILPYIPDHFTSVPLEEINNDRMHLFRWLLEHTEGRIGIERVHDLEAKSSFVVTNDQTRIGFEDPEEATMYSLFFK